jgi:hypothetical protein
VRNTAHGRKLRKCQHTVVGLVYIFHKIYYTEKVSLRAQTTRGMYYTFIHACTCIKGIRLTRGILTFCGHEHIYEETPPPPAPMRRSVMCNSRGFRATTTSPLRQFMYTFISNNYCLSACVEYIFPYTPRRIAYSLYTR